MPLGALPCYRRLQTTDDADDAKRPVVSGRENTGCRSRTSGAVSEKGLEPSRAQMAH